jgi:hypothetical protein
VAEQILPTLEGELDWTHSHETRNQHHRPSPDLEPVGQNEKANLTTAESEILKQR